MALSSWIRDWKRSIERRWALYNTLRRKNAARSLANRPRLEALEDRTLLSTYLVTSVADDGSAGSLRAAINQANNTASGITEIDFNIGTKGTSSGIQTISPGSNNPLPALSATGVFINGFSENQWQGVSSTSPLIELNGASSGFVDGLDVTGTNNTVSGLFITSFNVGIEIGAANNVIGGTTAGAGNVISGCTSYGVRIDGGATGNLVQGNYVGTDVTGANAQGNNYGFYINGSDNTIGGPASGAGNVISGNSAIGVYLNAAGNLVQGNYVGTNAAGTGALGNDIGIEAAASGNIIDGRNVISGNSEFGVDIKAGVTLQGNYIGTDHTGTNAIANAIGVNVATSGVVGGTVSGAGNVISGNSSDGISIKADGVAVQGNYIGTDHTGVNPLGNGGNGINIASNNNTVGGTVSGAGNIISANSQNGVLVSSGSGNITTQNSIFANTGLGISVASGANNNIVAPTISSASITGYTLTVKGSFTAATANVPYVLEFFGNTSSDAEGKAYIGALTVTPTSTGTQNFTYTTTTTVPRIYPLVTATLTDTSGDTSALSNGISAATIYVVTSAADSTSAGTLRDAIKQANNTTSGITTIDFAIGKSGSAQKISLTSALPALTAKNVFINGLSQGGLGNTTQLITLDGTNAGSSSNGVLLQGSSEVVSGLVLEHFNNGINVTGANNIIGGPLTSESVMGNVNVISGNGNVLSGNTHDGLLIASGATGNQALGNFIGTNTAGNAPLANSVGIEVAGNTNTIGSTTSINVISGNTTDGVLIDSSASGVSVLGNYIGTDVTGAKAVGNGRFGIDLIGSNNNIGGTGTGAGNVISGNKSDGVVIRSGVSGVHLQGNYIGTDHMGVNPLGNSGNGINIAGSNNTVGGRVSGAGNIISANSQNGVLVRTGTGNTITQNSIFANTGLGISVASGANHSIVAPAIGSASITGYKLTVQGSFTATANVPYVLEFFGNTSSDAEGKAYIGSLTVTPTTTGTQTFTYTTTTTVPRIYPLVTATLTNDTSTSRDTSAFSNGVSSAKIYVVTSAADDGSAGTLRDAINKANNPANGITTIDLAIGTSGSAQTISLKSALPALTANNVFINGLSQGGLGNATQLITLDGTSAGSSSNGVLLQGSSDVVSGLILEHFNDGIKVTGANNTVGGPVAGQGNVLSGNTTDGLLIASGATGNQVLGNFIGTDATGTIAVANKVGIEVAGNTNIIGGTTSGARNLISGNTTSGMLTDSGATGNQVLGNFIGTLADGTSPAPTINFPNGFAGSGSFFTYNGGAKLNGTALELCDGNGGEARSLFTTNELDITHFFTQFSFSITPAGQTADGMTFCIQSNANTALGGAGGSLGFQGIGKSIAIKFDVWDNGGEAGGGSGSSPSDSTGLFTDGANPVGIPPSIDMTPSGVILRSGDVMNVTLSYDGTSLTETVTDPTAKATFTHTYTIDIASTVGSNKAFIGFTGGTGGVSSTQQIFKWTYARQPAIGNAVGITVNGSNNDIGGAATGAGNVISGNTTYGLQISASGVTVQGDFIGTDVTGTTAASNNYGLLVLGNNNTIGGTTAGARNVISGNNLDGLRIGNNASGVVVLGNYVGTDLTGTKAVANSIGIEVASGSNVSIGGTTSGTRNFISGNTRDGVLIDGTGSGIQVLGNYIGTNKAGTAALGNNIGVEIAGKSNTVGGSVSGARNIISGNRSDGVRLDNTGSSTLVEGNYIGVNASSAALANSGNGLYILSSNNTVGGSVSGARNIISSNGKNGVLVSAGSGNTITRNSIYGNTGLGISLVNNANNKIAAPTLSSAVLSGGTLTVKGTFNAATANVPYVLEFFANVSGDPEGKIFLGFLKVTPTTTGTQSFNFTTTNVSQLGTNPLITATLTDNLGDTSAFSAGQTVT
jgi:parallel beta-helix repeat protein